MSLGVPGGAQGIPRGALGVARGSPGGPWEVPGGSLGGPGGPLETHGGVQESPWAGMGGLRKTSKNHWFLLCFRDMGLPRRSLGGAWVVSEASLGVPWGPEGGLWDPEGG